MEVLILDNGKEDCLMERVMIFIIKVGIFKVKGEKPRAGYFEDNVLVNESRLRNSKLHNNNFTEYGAGNSLILAMIPEIDRKNRKKNNSHKKRVEKSVNPVTSSSTNSFFDQTKRRTWRSRNK